VPHVVRVNILPRNRPRVVDAERESPDRAARIDRRKPPLGTAQIAVAHKVRVNVSSCDGPKVVEAYGTIGGTARAFAGAGARAGSVEDRKLSVGTSQEAVIHTVRITVDPRDRPQLIEA